MKFWSKARTASFLVDGSMSETMGAVTGRRIPRESIAKRRGALAASLTVLMSITACRASGQGEAAAQPAPTDATNAKVQALLDKTRKNLRFVEGGTFQMGDFGPIDSPEKLPYNGEQDNKFLHKVTLDSFWMSAYKSTYADLDVYSEATGTPKIGMDDFTLDHRYPEAAAGVKWQQAVDYCHWLGNLLKLPMDLPTEAQWEYAARNRGKMFVFATDNGKDEPGRNVWEYSQRKEYIADHNLDHYSPSLPLGQFPPTPLGLYDMMTDGFEWMRDWYNYNYYKVSPEKNPTGPAKGRERVLRSFRGSSGAGLSYGDGMTITRNHMQPDPPSENYKGEPEPGYNMTGETSARCVVNSQSARLPT